MSTTPSANNPPPTPLPLPSDSAHSDGVFTETLRVMGAMNLSKGPGPSTADPAVANGSSVNPFTAMTAANVATSNTVSGSIHCSGALGAGVNSGIFTVNNSNVHADSVVLLTVNSGLTDEDAVVYLTEVDSDGGSFTFEVVSVSGLSAQVKIVNFLVV